MRRLRRSSGSPTRRGSSARRSPATHAGSPSDTGSRPRLPRLWHWSVTELEAFWASIWEFFDVRASSPYERVLGRGRCPARNGSRARCSTTRSTRSATATRSARGAPCLGAAPARRDELGRARGQDARLASALRARRDRAGRPGRRLPAEHPRGRDRLPSRARASVRSGRAARPTSASAASSTASRRSSRSSSSPSTAIATAAATTTGSTSCARSRTPCPRSSGRSWCLPRPRAPPSHAGCATSWDALPRRRRDAQLAFAQVPFAHPLWVLYSSGTTGLPKAIVHGHGGVLLETLKKLNLHVDLHAEDRLFWFTTTGWMMWNFLVGGLLTRASILLYDGNPGHPDLGTLWQLADDAGVTCFGTSASYVAACLKDGVDPRAGRDLSRLTAVGSTGSPLAPEGFDWVYDRLGPDVWLFSTSGGTDVCTAFVGGVPTLPVYRGELQARALGAKVEAWCPRGVARRGGRRARADRADALDARRPLGRHGRRALSRELLRHLPRRLAARRLDRADRAWHGDHHGPLRRDDQPGRDPHGYRGDLPRGALPRRDRRCPRRRPAARRHAGVHAALRRPPRRRPARRRARRAAPRRGFARTAPPAMSRTRFARFPRCRGHSPARCSRCP